MKKEEAITAMKAGKKVTHKFFDKEEWVTMNVADDRYVITEEGCELATEFWKDREYKTWDTNWSIWKEKSMEGSKKVAILNGKKMLLSHHEEYQGNYGYFVTEGFVFVYKEHGISNIIIDVDIMPIKYDGFFEIDTDKEFENLPYPIFK